MDPLAVLVLAVLQGLTEFLPISSSGHLLLVPLVTGWRDQGLGFDLAVHAGTLVAVVTYFRREVATIARDTIRSLGRGRLQGEARMGWLIAVATIPVGLTGLAVKELVAGVMREPEVGGVVIALALIGFGALLAFADWRHRGHRNEAEMGLRDAVLIGCAQALALIPGTSRSGITMTAALLLGYSRTAAARFSFLLSIPVIVLASGVMLVDMMAAQAPADWGALGVGALLAGGSAFVCIHLFLAFISRIGMQPFVLYRVVLGAVLLVIFL